MTKVVGEARSFRWATRSSATAEFVADGKMVGDDVVVDGGGQIGHGAKLDDGEGLGAAPKPLA